MKETKRMMTPGATSAQRTIVRIEIFSVVTKGKLISGLVRENGRLFGVMMEKSPPAATAPKIITQSNT